MKRVRPTSGVTGTRKYICLAEYRCGCRPVGKGVSRNTMLRHCSIANVRRLSQLMSQLPWGPSFIEERETEIRHRHLSLPSHDQSTFQPYSFSNIHFDNGSHSQTHPMNLPSLPNSQTESGSNICLNGQPLHVGGIEPCLAINSTSNVGQRSVEHRLSPSQLLVDASSNTGESEGIIRSSSPRHDLSEGGPTEDLQNVSDSARLAASRAVTTRVVRVHEADIEHETEQTTQDENDVEPEVTSDHGNTLQIHDSGSTAQRSAKAFIAFKLWATENKAWIETCVDFSVTGALFDRILSLIGGPYQSATVKRNLIKYADFETSKYITCKPHMLIKPEDVEALPVSDDTEENPCNIRKAQNTQPDISSFEYLPLRPRIIAWYSTEKSYNELTSYRDEKLRERSHSGIDSESERFYEDYFDGSWFREISEKNGGHEAIRNDLFLSLSTDGFQTYANQTYDCWPIVALNHNLPPAKRFLLRNIIPMGYVKGPTEPTRLDTFFIPLIEELCGINADGGMEVHIPDGSAVRVRVHILWISADKAARNKIAGLTGQNGKSPCEECEIKGIWCPISKHYYFPSKVVCPGGTDTGVSRRRFTVFFDINRLPMRSVERVEEVWEMLGEVSPLSNSEKKKLSIESGVKRKTVLYRIASCTPFISFPHDSMHHIMNLSKDIFELLRGENRHLQREQLGIADEFVIPLSGWKNIDREIHSIGSGTSLSAFGPPPRETSTWRNYKAAECREFFCNYALILFEGHLKMAYLKGLRNYCKLVDLCRRPTLSPHDLDDLERCAKAFYMHVEKDYFRYDMRRLGIMKSTIHSLLHLKGQIERYGPMTNYNQFWVERQVGSEKTKLNATRLAAESMTENAKLRESFKIFYKTHFASSDDGISVHSSTPAGNFQPLPPSDACSLRDPTHRSYSTRRLLRSYLIRTGISLDNTAEMLTSDKIYVHGRLQVPCGDTVLIVGALKARRHRKDFTRADWYVAAEFEPNDANDCRDVYYGRILQVLSYSFGADCRALLLIDWAEELRVNGLGEVFCDYAMRSAFRNPTVEDASIIMNSIGVMEHQGPQMAKRTYFMDLQRRANRLLEDGKTGADGVMRKLRGRRR